MARMERKRKAVWVRMARPPASRAYLPAVEVKDPQSQGEVGLHGGNASRGAGLLRLPSDFSCLHERGPVVPPLGAVRTGGQPRPCPPRRAVASSRRHSGPSPGRATRDRLNRLAGPKLSAHQAGKAICGEIREPTGGEGSLRGGPDGRPARLRLAGRRASRSSAQNLVPAGGRPRALAGFTSNRRRDPATAARRSLQPPPPPRATGAGPHGCPGNTQCLCSE